MPNPPGKLAGGHTPHRIRPYRKRRAVEYCGVFRTTVGFSAYPPTREIGVAQTFKRSTSHRGESDIAGCSSCTEHTTRLSPAGSIALMPQYNRCPGQSQAERRLRRTAASVSLLCPPIPRLPTIEHHPNFHLLRTFLCRLNGALAVDSQHSHTTSAAKRLFPGKSSRRITTPSSALQQHTPASTSLKLSATPDPTAVRSSSSSPRRTCVVMMASGAWRPGIRTHAENDVSSIQTNKQTTAHMQPAPLYIYVCVGSRHRKVSIHADMMGTPNRRSCRARGSRPAAQAGEEGRRASTPGTVCTVTFLIQQDAIRMEGCSLNKKSDHHDTTTCCRATCRSADV